MSIADKLTLIAENQQKVYEAGQAAGGYSDGYEAGRYDELDLFWETYQLGGARTGYGDDYGRGYWTDETFKPKYTLYPTNGNGPQFKGSTITNYEALKMVDFSKHTYWSEMFRDARMTHLGVLDVRRRWTPYTFVDTFYGSNIETIDKFIVRDDGVLKLKDCFNGAYHLTNIVFEGVIGEDISFKACSNLTCDSIMSVIGCLQDISGTGTTKTLTLHATAKERITEEDIAIATQKGWTVA